MTNTNMVVFDFGDHEIEEIDMTDIIRFQERELPAKLAAGFTSGSLTLSNFKTGSWRVVSDDPA